MLDYVYGHDALIADFVARLIPHCRRGFGPNIKAMGVIEGGDLIAGIVWHNWDPEAGHYRDLRRGIARRALAFT